MRCIKCDGKLEVKNTYSVDQVKTQKLECVDCFCVHTSVVVLVNVDPERGEGAAALVKRIRAGERPWQDSLTSSEATPAS